MVFLLGFLVPAFFLLVSLIVLSKAADKVVLTASKLACFLRIGQLAIGFLLVSVTTSLPEFAVSVISSVQKNGAISAGNVFGSNIANILLILGIGALIYGFKVNRAGLKEIAIVLVATTVISVYIVFSGQLGSQILGFLEGAILLVIFVIYALHIILKKKRFDHLHEAITHKEAVKSFIWFFVSILIVIVSAAFAVDNAVKLSLAFNIAESFIGATIVAIGTSLPELTIGLKAIKRKQYDLALGDAVGSNMINLTLVLGTAAVINPIRVTLPIFLAALLFAIIANVVLFYTAAVDKKLGRSGGIVFLSIYALYLITIFFLQLSSTAKL